MGEARSHRDLIVWQKSMDLAVSIYRISSAFPRDERFRLTDQITRAVASVPANIAEGNARGTRRDYRHFISIARGSLMETETFLLLSIRIGYVSRPDALPALRLVTEVSKMLTALRARLLH